MAAIKVILRKKPKADGTMPLAIRVSANYKTSYIYLGHYIHEKDWDDLAEKVKKSHPNSTRLNNFILTKKAEANNVVIDMQTAKKETTPKAVTAKIKPQVGASFFAQATAYVDNMKKSGKYNRILTDESRIKHFKEFLNDEDVAFSEITVAMLNRYKAYLVAERHIAERTIMNHLIIIRTIYNQAISNGVADNKTYPFGKGKIAIKFPDSSKKGLQAVDLSKLEGLDLSTNPKQHHARNIWLFAFYFAGMRVSDVLRLKWSDIHRDRLEYAMGKNLKVGSLKIPEKALAILDQYKGHVPKNDLIFPELKVLDHLDKYHVERKISYATKILNKFMAQICSDAKLPKLTMHIARHTFAQLASDKIPVQILQRLYRHSSIITTMGYQSNFTNNDTDNALDSVLDFK